MKLPRRSPLSLETILTYGALIAGGSIVIGYLSFQARFLLQGPIVTLLPLETVQKRSVVIVEGAAENITEITLNGRSIFTDGNGNFKENLVLENGYSIMTLRAKDRFGRETVVSQPFVYRP